MKTQIWSPKMFVSPHFCRRHLLKLLRQVIWSRLKSYNYRTPNSEKKCESIKILHQWLINLFKPFSSLLMMNQICLSSSLKLTTWSSSTSKIPSQSSCVALSVVMTTCCKGWRTCCRRLIFQSLRTAWRPLTNFKRKTLSTLMLTNKMSIWFLKTLRVLTQKSTSNLNWVSITQGVWTTDHEKWTEEEVNAEMNKGQNWKKFESSWWTKTMPSL